MNHPHQSSDLSHRNWERYFDNAATSPLDPRVLTEMLPYLGDEFGNANSVHGYGMRAGHAVELARDRVAALIGAEDPSQIIFTSGATESNNQVLGSFESGAVSPFEHSSVREPALRLGFQVLKNQALTLTDDELDVDLVSLMAVNNEIGTVWDGSALGRMARYVHRDITQAAGKIPVKLDGIAFASFSGHKFNGPKGVGALYFRDIPPTVLVNGGEQENGLRGGTLNVPAIVGMGAAAAIAEQEIDRGRQQAEQLRHVVLNGLNGLSDWQTNGGSLVSPYILSMSFLGIEGEALVIEADRSGYAISSGAACSSQRREPSHVLNALGLDDAWARGTIRVSFGRFCTVESAVGLSKVLRHAVEMLRRMH